MNKFNELIKLGKHTIGAEFPPFVIAEMSGNHNQSLDRALKIVEAASEAGAHALKIQTYTADTMTIQSTEGDFFIGDEDSLWKGQSLYQLYKQAATPWEWHQPIQARCKELGLEFFSTPFDETAVDFLESLNVPFFKVASFENTHLPLIKKIAATGKPVIVSTGMATLSDLQELTDCLKSANCRDLILLKCTSTYPATPSDTNIRTIPHMQNMFGCHVGLSDHTGGLGVSVASVALGARVIEKHFTLSRSDGGVDSAFSLEPAELKQLVIETRRAWESLGQVTYEPNEKEKKSMAFRRSIYVVKDIAKGEGFTQENVRIIRPGFGLMPKHIDTVYNSRANKNLKRGMALKFSDLDF
jgi:pseudaminic acid synthase